MRGNVFGLTPETFDRLSVAFDNLFSAKIETKCYYSVRVVHSQTYVADQVILSQVKRAWQEKFDNIIAIP